MLHTTFRKAKEAGVCQASYRKMAEALGGVTKYGRDTPILLDNVLEVCGLDDALWALQIVIEPADKEIRLFACDCAERVLSLFETQHPGDKRPRQAIEVARRCANGQATRKELAAARDAAWAARDAAWAARAAGDAAWAARAAWAAGAAWDAAWAARDAAWAAGAAAWAARDAARDARAAERDWQKQHLWEMLRS